MLQSNSPFTGIETDLSFQRILHASNITFSRVFSEHLLLY